MKRLIFALFVLAAAVSARAGAGVAPVSLDWELLETEMAGTYNNMFVLKNVSDGDLGADWSIYFNMFPRTIITADDCPVVFSEVQTGYYKMTPKYGFKLGKGKSLKIEFAIKGRFPGVSYAPDGGHFAYATDSVARPLTIVRALINPAYVPKTDIYPTAERVYALNSRVNPVDVAVPFNPFEILPGLKVVDDLDGYSRIGGKFSVSAPGWLERELAYASEKLQERGLFADGKAAASLALSLISRADVKKAEGKNNDEYYEISIDGENWEVKGVTADAVLNGVKSVMKILDHNYGSPSLPNVEICDWPDFHYRGMMFDIVRNYTGLDAVKKVIDRISAYKLNVLQLHFADDEGWRLEIPGLPELTEVGSRRGMTATEESYMCQFYAGNGNPDDLSTTSNGYITRNEFIELLKYAYARGVRIVPEVETPGHARAAIVSMKARYKKYEKDDYDEAERYRLWDWNDTSRYTSAQGYHDNVLNPAQEGTYRFLEKVVDEILLMYEEAGVEMPFFHAGGDEVPKNPWTGSPDVRKLMEEKGFKTTHDVHEYFVVRMADIVSAKGIKVGGWQESAMGHDEATDKFLRDKFAGINSWNTIPDWGDDSIPYSIANNGYKVILSNVGNFYLDMAYNANPEEPGLSWGGYVDEYRSWEGRPYDIYHSTSLTLDGKPLGADVAEGKPVLNEESKKNIIGIQAQMFGETIRNFGMVELYMFPKIFGVVERAWNATVDDEKMELIRYNRLIGTSELPYLQRCNINFHLGMPGIRRSDDMIFMNSPYPEAEIRYTTDGKEPDSGSKLWKGPVKASGKVIKAKLFYLGKESKTVELR
ncbi:MAG: family 20 glycosylhydrolase [Bacteroidetes bacterium]|uniref:beta-N-acetylhexosaminidase n=1 Tax=Candidatus Limisoma faecipullorum TaxID=2840854 RepID=A0A9D9ISX7_9BACT|nr:family 20 glycosylhydrolase [Candidatus Limisoma faecipullorum]